MTPGEALAALRRLRADTVDRNNEDLADRFDEVIRTFEEYRNPDAEALAACVAELINLENAMRGTAIKIGRLLTRFSDYTGRASVTPPRRLGR